MSAGLPYLRGLRKSDLVVLAEVANLKDFEDYKKSELESALDNHLSANHSTLSDVPKLKTYYKRRSNPPRASPVKKEPKAESPSLQVEDVKRTSRKRGPKPKEEVEATDESDADGATEASKSPQGPARTPARRSGLQFPSLPPSPAVVTEAIDRQTTRARKSISEAWDASGAPERSDEVRSYLSSVSSIQTLVLALELFSLARDIVPLQYLTTFPGVSALHISAFPIKVPDVFVFVNSSFWSPFTLWLATSLVLPCLFAYFFNLSLKMSQQGGRSHTYGTRRASAGPSRSLRDPANFDPLVFHVSKALVAYLVYANQFTFWDVYSKPVIRRVAHSVPGGLRGFLTGSAVGTLGSLYEAVLRK